MTPYLPNTLWYPMLAQTWGKISKKHHKFPLIVQPKLNGMRCTKQGKEFFTRTGKPILSMPILLKMVNKVFERIPFDGELYCHGMSFEENQSICRPTVNIKEDSRINLVVFDINNTQNCAGRMRTLGHIFKSGPTTPRVQLIPCTMAHNEDEMYRWMSHYVTAGYEGIVLRKPDSPYESDKRSYGLMKLKPMLDTEAVVVDFIPGRGRLMDTLGALRCLLVTPEFEGKRVDIGSGFTDYERDKIWKDKRCYVNKTLTLRYQEKTKHGIPRFPTFMHWREPE